VNLNKIAANVARQIMAADTPTKFKKWKDLTSEYRTHYKNWSESEYPDNSLWNELMQITIEIGADGKKSLMANHPFKSMMYHDELSDAEYRAIKNDPVKGLVKAFGESWTRNHLKRHKLQAKYKNIDWDGIIESAK